MTSNHTTNELLKQLPLDCKGEKNLLLEVPLNLNFCLLSTWCVFSWIWHSQQVLSCAWITQVIHIPQASPWACQWAAPAHTAAPPGVPCPAESLIWPQPSNPAYLSKPSPMPAAPRLPGTCSPTAPHCSCTLLEAHAGCHFCLCPSAPESSSRAWVFSHPHTWQHLHVVFVRCLLTWTQQCLKLQRHWEGEDWETASGFTSLVTFQRIGSMAG